MKLRDLTPADGRASFYGKAKVLDLTSGLQVLYSYNTPVAILQNGNKAYRLIKNVSATTSRHIAAFCGLRKKEFEALTLYSPADFGLAA